MTTEPAGTPAEPGPAQAPLPPPPLQPPAPARPITETRPEILVGAALAGGFIAAQILGRIRGR
ncbi:MAG TPA: hypothetical protein VII98_04815 [Solirubrobacteraceae bacterium]